MKRRDFLKTSTLAGITLPVLLQAACQPRTPQTSGANPETSTAFPLEEATLEILQQKMQRGEYTSRAIAELYLKRIEAIDKQGPALRSILELNPDALTIADALDKERKDGKVRGPLHGIPVLVKDNIDTGDKMMTTAGSIALIGNLATEDAFIIARLREAGAVLLGKTNLSEWANFRSERSSSGWSSRGGQTKNPYVLDRNPCGSSSGSGTAVAANLCAIAIGTETNGSIACPSSLNGIVGIKPTVGLWSRSGIIPISSTQDTAGPMARTVKDAAILLGALCRVDAADDATAASQGKSHTDYTPFLDAQGLQGKRIGIEKTLLKEHEAVDALFQNAIDLMKKAGATIVEVDVRSQMKDLGPAGYNVLKYEFKHGLNQYLATAPAAKVKDLKALIAFNREHEHEAMPFFKQEILEASEALGDLDSPEYKESVKKTLTLARTAIDNTLRENKLDAVCGPANGPAWCTDLVNGDAFNGYGAYSTAARAGYPHITVPMGAVEGLPVGINFFSTAFAEPALITIAYAFEQLSHKRTVPAFLSTFAPGN